jgi:membrane fusion protein (multidrug efflux system)
VQQARASISAIQARIADRVLRAPFAGRVGLRNISVGELVEVGDTIVTLDDSRRIKLDFSVPAVYLPELKPGLPIEARADALGDTPFRGELTSVDTRVDPVTRAVQVRAVLPNPDGRIVPGVLMRVDLLRNTRQALVIPEAALVPQGDRQFVLVRANKDGTDVAEKRPVQIGARLAGRVEVVEGLAAGEQVISHGAIKVKPGSAIRILAVDDGSTDLSAHIKGNTVQAP